MFQRAKLKVLIFFFFFSQFHRSVKIGNLTSLHNYNRYFQQCCIPRSIVQSELLRVFINRKFSVVIDAHDWAHTCLDHTPGYPYSYKRNILRLNHKTRFAGHESKTV